MGIAIGVDTVTWAAYGQDLEDKPPWPRNRGVRGRSGQADERVYHRLRRQWSVERPALEIDVAESALSEIEDGKPRRECPGPGAPY
jgi:hypothetical protein